MPPVTSRSQIQYHNPFSELLEKPFWISCYKNCQTTKWSTVTSITALFGWRLGIVWIGRVFLFCVTHFWNPLSWQISSVRLSEETDLSYYKTAYIQVLPTFAILLNPNYFSTGNFSFGKLPACKGKNKQQKFWFNNFEFMASFVHLLSQQKNGLGIFLNVPRIHGVGRLTL